MEKNVLSIKIKEKRKEYKLNQKEFALRIGIGLATLRDMEQGKTSVKLSSILTVLRALNLRLVVKDTNEDK